MYTRSMLYYNNRFDTVTECWAGRAEDRPTFSEIVTSLSEYLERFSGYTVLSNEEECEFKE